MKIAYKMGLLMGLGFGLMAWPHFAAAQTCKDEESMWQESKKDLTELVITVKQESLPNYEKAYHQKSVVNKLTFFGIAVQGMLDCLDKAEHDSAASKENVQASRTQYENYAKLKEKIQHDLDTLKGLTASKDAKVYAANLEEVT